VTCIKLSHNWPKLPRLTAHTPSLHTVVSVPGKRYPAALALMLASGFAGLGYQIVWTQQCTLWLGHEAAAMLAVVTAFFGGLALGAWALGGRTERSARPERWYAACEAVIAVWGVALALLLDPVSQALLRLTGEQPGTLWQGIVAFIGTFMVLLPATAAMGATLPAMARLTSALAPRAHSIAALYAANTLGAVAGVLATAFWLVPELGLVRTALLCAMLNSACALAALGLRNARPLPQLHAPTMAIDSRLLTLMATGALGIGYEVLVVRVLGQVAEDTVYTWALLLAVYLTGTALGAAAWQRWGPHAGDAPALRRHLLLAQAAACLVGTGALWGAPALQSRVLAALGPGMPSALAAEAAMALAAFAVPTLVMGALFSHLCTEARAAGHSLGRALAFNTLGAGAAPIVFGMLLAPTLGPKAALLLVALAYVALAGWPVRRSAWSFAAVTAVIAMLALVAPPLAFVDVPEGGRIVSYRDGAVAAVSVDEDADGVRRLRINNRQQEGSSATQFADARQALLPLLLHPAPQRALFLGLGTGVTAASAAEDRALQVDAVELLPEVIAASAFFRPPAADPPRWHLRAADARRYVRTAATRYDLIVADNFHPARSGSGALYTVEHFAAVRERLAPGGLFCQWLPLHQLDIDTLRTIVRSFLAASPNAWALLATNSLDTPVLGLMMRAGDARFATADVRARIARPSLPQPLVDFGLADEFALLGSFMAGPASLARFAAAAPLNTDDRPVVAYRAPRVTYAPDSRPRDRLLSLLGELRIAPAELADGDAATADRLAAYWRARQRYLEVGQTMQLLADPRQMLAQVRAPLLDVLRLSSDFRPAREPLLRLAAALSSSDPALAQALRDDIDPTQWAQPK
jgi:spermidine synthase